MLKKAGLKAAVLGLFLAQGCGYNGPIQIDHLTITERSPERIAGYFEARGRRIDFDSTQRNEGSFLAMLTIDNGQELWADLIRHSDGEYDFVLEGGRSPMKLADIALFRFFSSELYKLSQGPFVFDLLPLHEQVLLKAIEYMGSVPEHYVHEKLQFKWNDLKDDRPEWERKRRKSCVYKGDIVQALFTDKEGNLITTEWSRIKKGSQRGQCGDKIASTGWTRDCFNHDMCHRYFKKNGFELPGGLGPNCLDEFRKAADDFFFSRFWGCWG
jgi:hypothetical protein